MKKVLVGMTLAVFAALAPAAVAKSHTSLRLPLVPLPASAIGGAAHGLPLQQDSGVVSNQTAASDTNGGATPRQIAALGRVTGYRLDYGNPFLPGNGVREVETGIDRYKSAGAARDGLTFWLNDELKAEPASALGVTTTVTAIRPPAAGSARGAYAITLSIPNTAPISIVDERVQDGAYLLTVTVAAGSSGSARQLAPRLAKLLDSRLRSALKGTLHGKAAKLPPKQKAGPSAVGPDPAKAALTTSDFTQATLAGERYVVNETALSEYDVAFQPAANFADVVQQVMAESTPSEATYYAALDVSGLGSITGGGDSVTPVDVSGVGDDAWGALVTLNVAGQTVYEAAVVLTDGPIVEAVFAGSKTPLAASDVTNLAQLAANRLNAAVTG